MHVPDERLEEQGELHRLHLFDTNAGARAEGPEGGSDQ